MSEKKRLQLCLNILMFNCGMLFNIRNHFFLHFSRAINIFSVIFFFPFILKFLFRHFNLTTVYLKYKMHTSFIDSFARLFAKDTKRTEVSNNFSNSFVQCTIFQLMDILVFLFLNAAAAAR